MLFLCNTAYMLLHCAVLEAAQQAMLDNRPLHDYAAQQATL